jgi:hypothetical protein
MTSPPTAIFHLPSRNWTTIMGEHNLLDTPYANSINARLGELFTVGNEGRTSLEKLIIDDITNEIKGRIKATAAHSWGKIVWTDYFSFPSVDNEQDIGVSVTAVADFIFNLETKAVAAGIHIPLGERSVTIFGRKYKWDFGELRISADQIKRISNGDIMALTESIPNLGILTKEFDDEYDETHATLNDKYGADNVYLARKDPFVNTLRPSKGFDIAVSAIATSGATAPLIMKELVDLALGELQSVTEWLQDRGIAAAQSVAQAILNGKGVKVPDFYLAVKWMPIRYRSRTLFLNENATPWIEETHGAFYIVVRQRNGGASQVSPDGFDVGTIGGIDNPGTLHPPSLSDQGEPQHTMDILGSPARDDNAHFDLHIENLTDIKIRVVVLRGTENPNFSETLLEPNATKQTHPTGVSERLIGVWAESDDRLLLAVALWIDQDLHISVGKDALTGKFWFGCVPA